LESLDFEWNSHRAAWKDRLSELDDYRKIHGHCNVPQNEQIKLATWVATQRDTYRLHPEGKTSPMTLSCIQELEGLGFEWDSHGSTWQYHLSELADYRTIHGHYNIPQNYSENTKLANWVAIQRNQFRFHREGRKSQMTLSDIRNWKAWVSNGGSA
jgi:hypothetical protein